MPWNHCGWEFSFFCFGWVVLIQTFVEVSLRRFVVRLAFRDSVMMKVFWGRWYCWVLRWNDLERDKGCLLPTRIPRCRGGWCVQTSPSSWATTLPCVIDSAALNVLRSWMVQRCLSPSLSFPTSMEVATVTVPVSVHLLSGSQNW